MAFDSDARGGALVRYEPEKPRGLFGRLKSGMQELTLKLGGPDLAQRLARITAPQNEYGVDPFGLDMEFAKAAILPMLLLYKKYFRVQTFGIEKVPRGRVLLIVNHSGQLPLDAAMVGLAMIVDAEPPRVVRSMVEKWAPTLPFISTILARTGQVVGTPENCRRLLAAGEAIQVYPEGVKGLNKTWDKRYQLQDFGLGFMRLALETDTPIVPVAVVGAEEQAMNLYDLKPFAKLLGFPAFPVTPTGMPFPLPTKYRIYFGDPMRFAGDPNGEDVELDRRVKEVKAAIQAMLNKGVADRPSVFW